MSTALRLGVGVVTVAAGSLVLLPLLTRAEAGAAEGGGAGKRSCLYLGRVWHRRFVPAVHAFWYSIFFSYLDLQVRRPDAAEGGGGACRPTTLGTRRQPGCVGA